MGEDLRGANKVVDLLGEISQEDLLGAMQRRKIKMTAGVNHLGGIKDLVVEGEEEVAGMRATSVGKRGIWLGNARRAVAEGEVEAVVAVMLATSAGRRDIWPGTVARVAAEEVGGMAVEVVGILVTSVGKRDIWLGNALRVVAAGEVGLVVAMLASNVGRRDIWPGNALRAVEVEVEVGGVVAEEVVATNVASKGISLENAPTLPVDLDRKNEAKCVSFHYSALFSV